MEELLPPEEAISFFSEDIEFELPSPERYVDWLNKAIEHYNYQLASLNYIFCSDAYLHEINVSYLNHDTYTDIITFDNAEEEEVIESDIFISVDRIKENANTFNVAFTNELKRVMIHGVLHLIGFKDKSPEEQQAMRKEESYWVQQYEAIG